MYDDSNRLDRMEALRLWTVGSSWFSTEEGSKGAVVLGQLADLAVLCEVPVSLRKAVRFIPGSESESLSHVLRKQGIHIVADTVPEVVADGTYLVEPGD
jgi:hypothetical protein